MNVVYRYGLLAPTESAELVADQMRKAHDYRNQLVQLERSRRDTIRKAESELVRQQLTRLEKARAVVESLLAKVRAERKRTKRRSEGDELKVALAAAKAEQKEASKAWRDARKEVRPHQQRVFDEANEAFNEARKLVRPGTSKGPGGLMFGTYQLVDDAVSRSSKMPLWENGAPLNPRFQRWTGEGFVSVQIGGGCAVDDVLNDHSTQVLIVGHEARGVFIDGKLRETDGRDPQSKRYRKNRRALLRIRVGSQPNKQPIWASFPMVLHRPLPDGCRIKRATVFLRKIGPRDEWCCQFVLEVKEPALTTNPNSVAIDLGWRERSSGALRIGWLVGSDGRSEEIILPAAIRSGMDRADSLRSTRDLNFGTARAELCAWMKQKAISFGDASKDIEKWRSPGRLAGLVLAWAKRRFVDDDDMFLKMEAWRKQDLHLWAWESSQRSGVLRRRKDWFRCFAKKLAGDYGTLVLEQFDLRSVQKRSEDKTENETSRHNRVIAAPSEFRMVLNNAFTRVGGYVLSVDPAHTTTTCHACSSIEEFDQAADLSHRCSKCGVVWDQDENAARNLLARQGEAEKPAAKDEETKLQRMKRRREEKVERMAATKAVRA